MTATTLVVPGTVRSGRAHRAREPRPERLSLDGYPHVRAWLARVAALPGFEPMPVSPIPEPERREG